MDEKESQAKAILRSKAKIMADRNERFAIIPKEFEALRHDINRKLDNLLDQIEDHGRNREYEHIDISE